jgi:hypothetical protein
LSRLRKELPLKFRADALRIPADRIEVGSPLRRWRASTDGIISQLRDAHAAEIGVRRESEFRPLLDYDSIIPNR